MGININHIDLKRAMKRMYLNKNAVSHMEYIALIIFILAAFLVFRDYIYRGFMGQWRKAGDAFGHGRQYDPRPFGDDGNLGGTQECYCDIAHCDPDLVPGFPGTWESAGYDCLDAHKFNTWIPKRFFDAQCDCTLPPEHPDYIADCLECINTAQNSDHRCGSDICG